MNVVVRAARRDDAAVTGKICHDAFEAISGQHQFPRRAGVGANVG
jgi:hypothetical protein